MLDITLGQYESFVAVFEHLNVSKAADAIGKSASSVSQSLKLLSQQLGVALFNSTNKGMIPTSHAMTLYPQAKRAMDYFRQSVEDARSLNADSVAIIRIIIPSSSLIVFGPFFKKFNRKYPNIKIEFFHRSQKDSFNQLMQGNVDFAIELDYVGEIHNLNVVSLLESKMIFIATREFLNEMQLTEKMTIEDFFRCPIIGTRNIQGLEPSIKTATVESTYSLVRNDVGIGMYFENLFQAQRPHEKLDIVEIQVEGIELPSIKMVYGYRKYLTKASKLFFTELEKFIASNS